jgi:hypothetical protein
MPGMPLAVLRFGALSGPESETARRHSLLSHRMPGGMIPRPAETREVRRAIFIDRLLTFSIACRGLKRKYLEVTYVP